MRYIIRSLRKLKDVRQPWKIKHRLSDILVISIIAIMCGATSSAQIAKFGVLREKWLRKFLPLENGMPHRLTVERVLSLLRPKEFQELFTEIMQRMQTVTKGSVVALDGKAFHTRNGKDGKTQVMYMVSAWCDTNKLTLGQIQADEKGNEITAIPELLALLDIKDSIVTIDAIGCQHEIVKMIRKDKKADYGIALKANQPTMCSEMRTYAQDCLNDPLMKDMYVQHTTLEKGHGRIEKRVYSLFHDLRWFKDRKQWYGLASLIRVDSTRTVGTMPPTYETRYYISSLTAVQDAARAIRAHWGIENRLHWVLDVVSREDGWVTRQATLAANLATIRKLALAFLRKTDIPNPHNLSGPMKMWACALDLRSLESTIFGSTLFS